MAVRIGSVGRLAGRLTHERGDRRRAERIEQKRAMAVAATRKWEEILHEMEMTGKSGTQQYEAYFDAYLRAKQQQKQADLDAFNLRTGLGK